MIKTAIPVIAAGLLAAACSSASAPAPQPSPTHQATVTAGKTSFASSPIRFRIVACGKLSAHQQAQAGVIDKYAVLIREKNTSKTETYSPQFSVTFLNGSNVDGQNSVGDNGSDSPLGPGQSELVEGAMVNGSGHYLRGDTCQVIKEALFPRLDSLTAKATYYGSATGG